MRVLNNIISNQESLLKSYVDEAEEGRFTLVGENLWLDVNNLALIKGKKEELPVPCGVVLMHPPFANRHVRALVLQVTHDCNLRCKYCYVQKHYPNLKAKMSFEVAKLAIDKLFEEKAVEKFGAQIGFFGGEPLLNFDVIKKVVAYAKEKFGDKVRFHMTTNGTLIVLKHAKFLADHNFTMIVSLDGDEELHNETRMNFNQTMVGLQYLKEAGISKVTLRSTVLPERTELLRRVKYLNELCDKGYGHNVSVEPAYVTEAECVAPAAFTLNDVDRLEKEYHECAEYLAQRLNEGKLARFHNIMVYAERLLYRKRYVTECGAGVGFVTVNPLGEIFACHRQMHGTYIGSLSKGGIDERLRAKWLDNRCYTCSVCSDCDIRNICGGPCREHSIGVTGSPRNVDPIACNFKHIWIKSAAHVLSKLPELEMTRMIPEKKKPNIQVVGKELINLVREAGGFGDIISIGGAAAQIKHEKPKTFITACIPTDFVDVAKHLKHIDAVMGLGSLEYLAKNRRERGDKEIDKYPYLKTIPIGRFVDLWCPGWEYETKSKERLTLTRSRLFALTAGCKESDKAIPEWKTTDEEKLKAAEFLKNVSAFNVTVGFTPRGTKVYKSFTQGQIRELTEWLYCGVDCEVIYLDCLAPPETKDHLYFFPCDFSTSVAIAEQCDIIVSVDTGILHAAAALGVPTVGVFFQSDPRPYQGFYPHLEAIGVEHRIEGVCEMPCNSSKLKGYSRKCAADCLRHQDLDVGKVREAIVYMLNKSMQPDFRKKRMERIMGNAKSDGSNIHQGQTKPPVSVH